MGLAAHDQRAIESKLSKMLKIRPQSPRQLTLAANDQIVANRCDQHHFHVDVRAAERVTGKPS
jgi:acyl dehydratase